MRIAYFLNDFPVLSQTFILNQITGIIDSGADVKLFAFRKTPMAVNDVHEIIHKYELLDNVTYLEPKPKNKFAAILRVLSLFFSRATLFEPMLALKVLRGMKNIPSSKFLQFATDVLQSEKHTFDVIHCQFGTIAPRVLNLIETGRFQGKLVTSFRGFDATKYPLRYPGVYKQLFDKGDFFLPVSRSLRKNLIDLGCSPEKIDVLHSGLEMNKFLFHQKNLDINSPIRIITIGRLVDKKGIDYAVKAIAIAISAGKSIQYSIVGSGPLKSDLQLLVDQLGINEQVEFLGSKTHREIVKLLSEHHILVAPSVTANDGDKEGIPNVMKEAMAVGLPTLGTRHGGIPELVEHNKSGYLVDEKDTKALADMIIYMCDHPEEWSKICSEARSVIQEEFDIKKLSSKLVEIYANLINNTR